jgi:hypothetical protein
MDLSVVWYKDLQVKKTLNGLFVMPSSLL